MFEHYQFLPAFVVLLALVIALQVRRATERVAARRIAVAVVLLLSTCSALACPNSRRRGHPVEQGAIARSERPDGSRRAELESGAPGQSDQTEALEGLARLAKQNGDAEALRRYLERLRKIDPANPAIDAIEKARVLTPQDLKLLDDAGRLAAQQKPDEAMAIYRRVFGDTPPPGKWAEAFYETEAASAGGREQAIAQLRERSSRDPANEVYRLWLARLLTYDPATRQEGLRAARVDSRSWRRRSGASGVAAGAALGERQPGRPGIARGLHAAVSRSRVAEQPQRAARISGAA